MKDLNTTLKMIRVKRYYYSIWFKDKASSGRKTIEKFDMYSTAALMYIVNNANIQGKRFWIPTVIGVL